MVYCEGNLVIVGVFGWMLSAAARPSLVGLIWERHSPIPGWIIFTNSVVVTIAVLTLGFLGTVYLLRKVLKKRLDFNPTRVFIAAFLMVLLGVSFSLFILTLIYGLSTSSHYMNPVELATTFLVLGAFGSIPSLVAAAISALIYEFRMHVRKRAFAVGGIVLTVGFILQLCVSAFIVRQWLHYWNVKNVSDIIPDWMINLNYPISTVIMTIGILTIACSLLYKPIKTYSLQLKQHM